MREYLKMMGDVLAYGKQRTDRTGTGTISIFDYRAVYDLREGFPMVTTAEKSFDNIKGELLWFLEGSTNANVLAEKYGFKIWKKWAKDKSGDLGRIYGKQWRSFRGVKIGRKVDGIVEIDQIQYVINEIKNNPYSRRMVVSAWNPADMDEMALPPCHWAFELYVDGDDMDTLNMKFHQRSCDVFLGVPYNISSYALLLSMLAQVTGKTAGILIHDMSNVHIYNNHIEQCREQLGRSRYPLPVLSLNPNITRIDGFRMEDINLLNYEAHPKLRGEVSI